MALPPPDPAPTSLRPTTREYLTYVEALALCDETYGAASTETLARIAHAIALSGTVTTWQKTTVRAIVNGAGG